MNHAGNKSQTWPRQIGLNFKDRVLSSEILKTIKCCNKSVKTIKRIAGTIMITSLDHIVLLKVFLKRLNVNHCHHLLFHPILMRLHIQNHMLFSVSFKQKTATLKTRDRYCPELTLLLDLLVNNLFFIVIMIHKL